MRTAFIFCGGGRSLVPIDVPDDALVVAADGGLGEANRLGVAVDLLVGDLDSASPADVESFEARGGDVRRHPVDKDATDLDLAITEAIVAGVGHVVVVGGDGGRLDHLLANAVMLASSRYAAVDVDAVLGSSLLHVVRGRREITGVADELISLLALGGPARGVRTEGVELRGCVPVSVRGQDERSDLGNRITMMACPLPVYADDPRTRFRIVNEAMRDLKESKQALGAEVIAGLQDFAPPTIFAQASRLNFSSRVYNLLVTNVPGPQFPLYLRGRKLETMVPIPFLAPEKALAIAVFSYDGGVHISLMGDYEAMHDLDVLGGFVEDEIAVLREAAEAGTAETAAPA